MTNDYSEGGGDLGTTTNENHFGRDVAVPVLVPMAIFCLVNFLWNTPVLGLYDVIPHSLPVYLVAGCLLPLWFLCQALRPVPAGGGRPGRCLRRHHVRAVPLFARPALAPLRPQPDPGHVGDPGLLRPGAEFSLDVFAP